jgi:hypothetical protein
MTAPNFEQMASPAPVQTGVSTLVQKVMLVSCIIGTLF